MSVNISIKEGGKARSFGPVKALMVQGEDGKYYPWFPESDRELGTLSVDKNGIYRASDRGVYGWSRVYVNVPTSEGVTGRDPDTGEEVYVHPDPETGELVTDVLPGEIRVIEPPTNPYGVYVDGQTITKDGMVVKAYDANGDEMQIVPNGEVTLNPTTAIYDPATDVRYSVSGGIHAVGVLASNIYQHKRGSVDYYGKYSLAGIGTYFIGTDTNKTVPDDTTYYLTKYNGDVYVALNKNSGLARYEQIETGITPIGNVIGVSLGKTFNTSSYFSEWFANVPTSTENPLNKNIDDLEPEGDQAGSHQTITVSWSRPGDGAVLETTFDILVGPHGGTGDD